jgi:hypothetical protein
MKPDMGLIVAVQRNQTGADIHKLNNLLPSIRVCLPHGKRNFGLPRQTRANDRGD